MTRASPTSVRWTNPSIPGRLDVFTTRHPGFSVSAAVSTLVDEGLRMAEHPGIVFRYGPAGRRASLAAGSDVWEVIRSLRDAKAREPGLTDAARVQLVADNSGLTVGQVRTAVDYYASYPDEIDRRLSDADAAEEAALAAWERRVELLS